MYFKNVESNTKPSGLEYNKISNEMAFVMIRRNIKSETRKDENSGSQTVYVYDEVQFKTNQPESYVANHEDDLFNMLSGSTPSMEERLDALEKAVAEIGGLL